jgi:hypothetical protein
MPETDDEPSGGIIESVVTDVASRERSGLESAEKSYVFSNA